LYHKKQIREFLFKTNLFERYSRVEKALDSVILESYIQGVSTRNVRKVIESPGLKNVSASYISSPSSELDVIVKEFMERKIGGQIKYIYIDATYFKIRDSGNTVEWESFFDDLKERGLHVVEPVISDGHNVNGV
jgi:putative transposase